MNKLPMPWLRDDIEYRVRRCEIYLNERDEVAFSRALREFEPKTLFFEEDRRAVSIQEFTTMIPNIAHSRSPFVSIALPSPGQDQNWETPIDYHGMVKQSICRFIYRRSAWIWHLQDRPMKADPPHMIAGELSAHFPVGDEISQKFAMKVLRLVRKVTWRDSGFGIAACRWSQTGGPVRRSITGSAPLDPALKIDLNGYYDDSSWDDRLPDVPTIGGYEYLEWHLLPVRKRPFDLNDR